jgi:hypothetical protein
MVHLNSKHGALQIKNVALERKSNGAPQLKRVHLNSSNVAP